MRISSATRSLVLATFMEECWSWIRRLAINTLGTEMWCPVVCTVAREGPAGARSLPACVRCCSITAVLSCKDQPIASGNCRDCALTPHSCIHNHHLLLQALSLVPLGAICNLSLQYFSTCTLSASHLILSI